MLLFDVRTSYLGRRAMPSGARIGLAETDREVLCQAYEQAKQHPRREATPGDDDDLPKWLGAEKALLQRGYADCCNLEPR